MSIELPEAKILARQMNSELRGKHVESIHLQDYERLQRIGMINKDSKVFDMLVNREVQSVASRGCVILVKFSKGMNLILAPEGGGRVLYSTIEETAPSKFHLKVDFSDNTALTVRLISMGIIKAIKESDLDRSYVYRRDFNPSVSSPIDEEFTFEHFSQMLINKNRMLKSVLVGKEAIIVGLGNSAFQDIIYRAKLHPKRKASELNKEEQLALYEAIRLVLRERMRLNGKDRFYDLYGNQGSYSPAMGPSMKGQTCPACATSIEKLSVGGGHVYLCPKCQT